MKRFVMILPPSPWLLNDRDQVFTGALYVVSYCQRHPDWEIDVCDLSSLEEKNWYIPVGDMYGITGVTPHFPIIKKIIDKLKEREPHKPVYVGGVHATVLPEHLLQNTKVDGCVRGAGERPMWDLLCGEPPSRIAGICTRETWSEPVQLDVIDTPFPAREKVDYYEYLKPRTYKYLGNLRDANIMTSRGCPYKCCYCASNTLCGGKIQFRSPKNVAAELKHLKEEYDIGMCCFSDDTFILNKERVKEICRLIKDLGVRWYCLTRVDHVDEELFKIMVDAGCMSIAFGLESGSNKVLKAINKNTTVEQAYEALYITKKAGLRVRGQLMVGLPFEENEDIEATKEMIINIREDVDTLGLHIFQPYPGTDAWDNPEKYGLDIDKTTDFNDWHTIGSSTNLRASEEILKRYKYLLSAIAYKNIEHYGAKE